MNASEPAPNAAKPSVVANLLELPSFQLRFLFLLVSRDELLNVGWVHLAWGLVATLIAGMGRWWDDDDAVLLQSLGFGSVIYVFVLAALIWFITMAMHAPNWTYMRVLTYITLTAPLAWIYALPVELFMSADEAANTNINFLIVVSMWRMVLLLWLLMMVARLSAVATAVAWLLPPVAILSALSMLNLHHVVIVSGMGGVREPIAYDPDRAEFHFITGLTCLAWLVAPVLGILWLTRISYGPQLATAGVDAPAPGSELDDASLPPPSSKEID